MPAIACKLCLVGEPGVGKTSLAQRLLRDRFPPDAELPGITVVAHRLTTQAGDSVSLTLWDVAGNCALDSLNQAFLSGIDALAAVADVTSPASIERALVLIQHVRHFYPEVVAALLLNKCDLAAEHVPPRVLPTDVAAFEVSARDGRGVEIAFAELARSGSSNRAPRR